MYFRPDAVEMKGYSTFSNVGRVRVCDAVLCASKNIYGLWHYTVKGIVEDCTLVPLSRSFDTPDEADACFQATLEYIRRERQARWMKKKDFR